MYKALWCDFLTSKTRFFLFTRNTQLDVDLTQYTNNNFLGEAVTTIVLRILSCAVRLTAHQQVSEYVLYKLTYFSAHDF